MFPRLRRTAPDLLIAALWLLLLLTALLVVGALTVALRNGIVARRSIAAIVQDTGATCSALAWLHLLGNSKPGLKCPDDGDDNEQAAHRTST